MTSGMVTALEMQQWEIRSQVLPWREPEWMLFTGQMVVGQIFLA
jgi:hypothetical protein